MERDYHREGVQPGRRQPAAQRAAKTGAQTGRAEGAGALESSPRVLAQRQQIQRLFGGAQQRPRPGAAPDVVQPKLENESVNKHDELAPHATAVSSYVSLLNQAVEDARAKVATKYFVHVAPVDGYMQNFLNNFNSQTNEFNNGKAVPRQAGYWIESYATKIVAPSAGGGLDVLLQARRGNSRPDVILQYKGFDVAWLDITSGASEGHIYDKNSAGWYGTPYVSEVTYAPLKLLDLNVVSVPGQASQDIKELEGKAAAAKERQLRWEGAILEKYGLNFAGLMQAAAYYVKESAVSHEEMGDMSGREMDEEFSSSEAGNRFERLALDFMRERAGKRPEPAELAAVLMYWSGMLVRYNDRYKTQLPPQFNVPTKAALGLSWVKNISSADGEPIVREWFSV